MSIERKIRPSSRVFKKKDVVHYNPTARFITFFDQVNDICLTWHTPHPVQDFDDLWAWYEQSAEFHNGYFLYSHMNHKI